MRKRDRERKVEDDKGGWMAMAMSMEEEGKRGQTMPDKKP